MSYASFLEQSAQRPTALMASDSIVKFGGSGILGSMISSRTRSLCGVTFRPFCFNSRMKSCCFSNSLSIILCVKLRNIWGKKKRSIKEGIRLLDAVDFLLLRIHATPKRMWESIKLSAPG